MYYNAGKQAWHSDPIWNATRTPILQSREESQCQGQGPDELGSVHFRRTLYRYVVRFEAASLNTLLMALASVPSYRLPRAKAEPTEERTLSGPDLRLPSTTGSSGSSCFSPLSPQV